MARSVFDSPQEIDRLNARLAELEQSNILTYAETAISNLEKQGKIIRDKRKEIKQLAALKTRAEREAYVESIRLNYADRDGPRLQADDGEPYDPPVPSALEILRYGEENNIDVSTDAGLRKAVAAMTARPGAA